MSRYFHLFCFIAFPTILTAAGHEVATSGSSQAQAVVTGNASGFVVAWLDQSAAEQVRSIKAARISRNGEPQDGPGIALEQKSSFSVAIAHGPSESLIIWSADGNVWAGRLGASGASLDPAPLLISQHSAGDVAVAWDGNQYFVVWSDASRLFGSFVGTDGTVSAPKAFLDETKSGVALSSPSVSRSGPGFLVAFSNADPLNCTCYSFPDRVSVMRVSSTGDAIDLTPVRISGMHFQAHVASSGAESLIVLDNSSDVLTMTAHEDGGKLQLGPEVSLFHWFFGVSSNVAWDGSEYVVGWRYPAAVYGAVWLAAARIENSGQSKGTLFSAVEGTNNPVQPLGPSLAANDAGEVALVTSALPPLSSVNKARLFLMSELAPMPAAPAAPRNVISYFSGNTARIDWQSDDVPGFVIERSLDFGKTWYVPTITSTLPSGARTTTVYASVGDLFRVRALGPGGLSEGTITSIGSQFRRHASH